MTAIRVLQPGLMTSVQDLGRYGYAHVGITPAGAADSLALRVANRLLGNSDNEAALEITLLGPVLEFDRAAMVAITGADIDCRLGTARAPMWAPFPVLPGSVLKCGSVTGGARSYLAVQGGFDLPPVMGSVSTLRSAHLGGLEGRALKTGDELFLKPPTAPRLHNLKREARAYLRPRRELRLTAGPQASWFGDAGMELLQRAPYVVSGDSDRRGVRLKGEALIPPPNSQLITEGISLGAMQVPPDGQPIILFVDQQTTGGYPKATNVIAADLRHLAQLRPRDEVQFRVVSLEEALRCLREQEAWLKTAFI